MDFKLLLRENLFFLWMVGLWPFGCTQHFNIYKIYAIISLSIFGIFHAFFEISSYFHTSDITVLTTAISISTSVLMALIKAFCFFKHVPNIIILLTFFGDEIFQPKNKKQEKIINNFFDIWRRIFQTLLGAAIITSSSIAAFQIFMSTRGEGIKRLPFPAWYPFNFQSSPYYEFACFYQVASTWFLVFLTVNVDVFAAAIMTYVAAFCSILCDNLRNINHNIKIKEENDWHIQFVICVKLHQEILKFAKEGNVIIDTITIWQFIVIVLGYCMTMFQLSIISPTSIDFYLVIMYQGCLTIQVLMYCWFGHQVLTESEKIPFAIYECDWTSAPLQFKKNMALFICRTNRPIRFQSLNFFTLSLETFSTILTSSYSYSALLRRVKRD